MSDPKTELLKQAADLKARIGKTSHYEVFGIPDTASTGDIKKAYFKFVKTFHPDSLVGMTLSADEMSLVRSVFSKLTEIHDSLTDTEKRKEYDELLKTGVVDEQAIVEKANRILKSELEFQKGEILVRRGKFPEAIEYLRSAVKLAPDEADNWAVLAWATYSLREGSKDANRAKGRKYLEKAFQLKPDSFRAHYYQGLICKIDGNKSLALTHLKRAYELDPTHEQCRIEFVRLGGKTKPGAA
ncbi:MAG: DnaJ domain-containing protein [Deltaproteobacteria bacterium]|nr:DnaJ domain-containing protein [Deltaproteobacteria bacterium]